MAPHRHHPTHPHTRRGSRFFRSGELHLVLLALLAERPRHGYDLMGQLEANFGPTYTPSPGSIYPALSALEAESLIEGQEEGERKVFSVTDLGRDALAERQRMLADVEARTGARLSGGALEPALGRLVARVRGVASRVDAGEVERVLDEAGDRVEALVDKEETR
jgi:DNA-binding PadR family transcriptional regulator